MHNRAAFLAWTATTGLMTAVQAACPFADPVALLQTRDTDATTDKFLEQYVIDDSSGYMTSDVGGPIEEQFSLKAGVRGSTLLEDFIFRQKIQHFDHERVGACFLLLFVLLLGLPV
jgi:Catalase